MSAEQGRNAVIIVAGGTGERTGFALPKQYVAIGGVPMLRKTVQVFLDHPRVAWVIVVRQSNHAQLYQTAMEGLEVLPAADAGPTRQDSVRSGLEALAGYDVDHVLVHDAARPFVSAALIDRVLDALDNGAGAVIPVVPVTDTIKRVEGNIVRETLFRAELMAAQTPQGFRLDTLLAAHRAAKDNQITDDAAPVEKAGLPVVTVVGDVRNLKVTTGADMERFAARAETRVGQGYDVHRFSPNDLGAAEVNVKIRICGVDIPHLQTLEGHSDADVGLHAITDAILGGLGAGDIGQHFPPSDPQWKGADSAIFLGHAATLAAQKNAAILYVDVTIICEAPKIAPYRETMRDKVASLLGLSPDRISIKATTTEGLGFTGRAEGIAAQAVATLQVTV